MMSKSGNMPLIKRDIINKIRRECSEYKVCLHPDAGNACGETIVGAHTVSRHPFLLSISCGEKRKFVYEVIIIPERDNHIKIDDVEIESASEFYGFCDKHDRIMFFCIEGREFICDLDVVFSLSYRAVAHGVYGFRTHGKFDKENLRRIVDLVSFLNGNVITEENIRDIVGGGNACIDEKTRNKISNLIDCGDEKFYEAKQVYLNYCKEKYISWRKKAISRISNAKKFNAIFKIYKDMPENNYKFLRYCYLTYDGNIGFACSSSFGYDELYCTLHIHVCPIQNSSVNNGINKTVVILSWNSENREIPDRVMSNIFSNDVNMLANYILFKSITQHGNIFFNKIFLENNKERIEKSIKKFLLKYTSRTEFIQDENIYNIIGNIPPEYKSDIF
ncbi:hypothetical protein [Acetobacter ascendens]|uniref:Uncharacterized protein n=1 Tax=Acetobacter ascendens TaxID=481146 RepID=A0A1Y0UYN5_9PROT|nr:hypothetical protein [Acetobacter ascendens]ARW10885.1 hypothetical protein S101447_01823 [Acetobacter ascendens]